MTNPRACVILYKMKKLFRFFFLLLMILVLTTSFFSCKKKDPTSTERSESELAIAAVTAAIPDGEDNDAIASSLLSLLHDAGMEKAEIVAVLLAFEKEGTTLAPALLALQSGAYGEDNSSACFVALQTIANAVSPEVAGDVFFTAAMKGKDSLPYTRSDCNKIASLILGQDTPFGADLLEEIRQGDYSSTNEKELNTLLLSLASSLRKAVGISAGAKEYLSSLAETAIQSLLSGEELSDQTAATLAKGKALMLSLLGVLRDGYDVILTYAANFLSYSDARLILGLPYEKQEATLYYGYRYATWESVLITKEEYEARSGDYDDYFLTEVTQKGFTVGGDFRVISEEDADLADRVYRLLSSYRAYSALTDKEKSAFLLSLDAFLTALSSEQELVAAFLDRTLIEESGASAASAEEMISALAGLASFDATDGVSEGERTAASQAIGVFESYLHGYLPKIY